MNLLPVDNTFFLLFRRITTLLRQASELFAMGVTSGSGSEAVYAASIEMKSLEEQGDCIVQKINQQLCKTFLTPFDPSDVKALASTLDDVLDAIEDTTFRIAIYKIDPLPSQFACFGQIVYESCAVLQNAIEDIIHKRSVTKSCLAITDLERNADLLERQLLRTIFKSEQNAITVVKIKEIVESAERIADRCDDVANLLEHISAGG
ncbi:MAG TPA: DUF47 family protein [Bryobacteraceae bacterium]|nr:DUF47 family protein [Bryobacteraceae bacterium]